MAIHNGHTGAFVGFCTGHSEYVEEEVCENKKQFNVDIENTKWN